VGQDIFRPFFAVSMMVSAVFRSDQEVAQVVREFVTFEQGSTFILEGSVAVVLFLVADVVVVLVEF